MNKPRLDLRGKMFGRLFVIAIAGKNKHRKIEWWTECDCGEFFITLANSLLCGDTRSCGCLQREIVTIHGYHGSPTYHSWMSMKVRCLNSHTKGYSDYGGRGISVCDHWFKFENFLEDMGKRPPGLTLERVNNDGNYEPGNCVWATYKEQAQNRRPKRRNEIGNSISQDGTIR